MSVDALTSLPTAPLRLTPQLAENFLQFHLHSLVESPETWVAWVRASPPELYGDRPLPDSAQIQLDYDTCRFLHGIQGNVLKPHGRTHTVLLFFRHHGGPDDLRHYINAAASHVTTALMQYRQARHKARAPDAPFISFALTNAGIAAADCAMPTERDKSFKSGMYDRKGAFLDGDWEAGPLASATPPHGMWLLACESRAVLAPLEQTIRGLGGGQVELVIRETAVILRNQDGDPVEPFGFRDGLSMPEFFERSEGRAPALVDLPLNRVLLETVNDDRERGGSFLVYRKLRQDVRAFRDFEQRLAAEANRAGLEHYDAGRLIVGRTREGLPLATLAANDQQLAGRDLNAYDFVGDSSDRRCPYHAHIRKANPRSLVGRTSREDDLDVAAQIVRRGVVFNSDGQTSYRPTDPPPENTGLLFMAYMADIYSQFEVMHSNWMSQSENPRAPRTQPDPLLYGGSSICPVWKWQGLTVPVPRLVTPLGGAYLFVPPLAWLRNPPRNR